MSVYTGREPRVLRGTKYGCWTSEDPSSCTAGVAGAAARTGNVREYERAWQSGARACLSMEAENIGVAVTDGGLYYLVNINGRNGNRAERRGQSRGNKSEDEDVQG